MGQNKSKSVGKVVKTAKKNGRYSKSKTNNNKNSKNYEKPYRGQGR